MARRLVYFQRRAPQAPAMFLLWEGPDGYYVGKPSDAMPTKIVPYSSDSYSWGIFWYSLIALGAEDWRFTALGKSGPTENTLFWWAPDENWPIRETLPPSPSGFGPVFVTKATVLSPPWQGDPSFGLMQRALFQSEFNQAAWHTEDGASGVGAIFPVGTSPPRFALPGVISPPGMGYPNTDLSWYIMAAYLVKADGTRLDSDFPPTFPVGNGNLTGGQGRTANAVGLTLFTHEVDGSTITTIPYTFDVEAVPELGYAPFTTGDTITTPYTYPGSGYTLRRVSYWAPTP
jgi:hypothetical protein